MDLDILRKLLAENLKDFDTFALYAAEYAAKLQSKMRYIKRKIKKKESRKMQLYSMFLMLMNVLVPVSTYFFSFVPDISLIDCFQAL